jgi:hypothetical protein
VRDRLPASLWHHTFHLVYSHVKIINNDERSTGRPHDCLLGIAQGGARAII